MRARKIVSMLAVVCLATDAQADDAHYQDFLVGGRAIGLGGAFTSIANDPSGLYYNPSGIVDASRSNLQLSTSLYGFERGSIPQGLVTPVPGVEDLHLEFTDLIIVPASAGFVTAFGSADETGRPNQAYGLSVVVPSYRSFTAGADTTPISNTTTGAQTSYQRRVTDRELWTGIGVARRVTDNLRLGVSGYYILRSVTDREDVVVGEHVNTTSDDTATTTVYERFQAVTDDVSFINGSVVIIGGALYSLTPRIALGASFSLPSVSVHSQARLSFSRATADPLATNGQLATLENLTITGYSQQDVAPTTRLGISYIRPYKYTLSADASYHAPVSYSLIRPKQSSEELFNSFSGRLPFSPTVRRRAVANFNLGSELLLVREVSIAGGFFSDFSSSPTISASPTHDQPPDVDLFGISMSVGYFGTHTLSRLGMMYSFGTGHDVIPESDIDRLTEGQQAFRRVSYFQSFFYVFLSSTFRY